MICDLLSELSSIKASLDVLRKDDESVKNDVAQLYFDKEVLELVLDAKKNLYATDTELIQNRGAVTVPLGPVAGGGRLLPSGLANQKKESGRESSRDSGIVNS